VLPAECDLQPGNGHVLNQTLATMSRYDFLVVCPYCGEGVEIFVEPDVTGTFVQDCEVCCHPWTVRVFDDGDDERHVTVERADGGE
jgi:hypothetical protein